MKGSLKLTNNEVISADGERLRFSESEQGVEATVIGADGTATSRTLYPWGQVVAFRVDY